LGCPSRKRDELANQSKQSVQKFTIDGKEKVLEIFRSRRKTLCLELRPGPRFILRAPLRTSESRLMDFFKARLPWLESKLENLPAPRSKPNYLHDSSIVIRGQRYTLEIIQMPKNKVRVLDDARIIQVQSRQALNSEFNRELIIAELRKLAKTELPQRLRELEAPFHKYGVSCKGVKIKLMKSQWGSCSSKGNINLNLKLMMVSPECRDYVILHELCHLLELSHNRRFYTLMTEFEPDWKRLKSQLKQESQDIGEF